VVLIKFRLVFVLWFILGSDAVYSAEAYLKRGCVVDVGMKCIFPQSNQ
jgi:hypothetical protein